MVGGGGVTKLRHNKKNAFSCLQKLKYYLEIKSKLHGK